MKGRNLSFRINEYDIEDYNAYKKLMHDYPTLIKMHLTKIKYGLLVKSLIKLKIMVIISLNI